MLIRSGGIEMVAAVEIRATHELEVIQPSIDDATRLLQDRLNALAPDEVAAVIEAVARALAPDGADVPEVVGLLSAGHQMSASERAEAEVDVLMRSFQRRRELLDGALTTSQVARLLGTSRQTPHDRVASGSLLAVMDRGTLRFPAWQFDPTDDEGVVAGLPRVIRALDVSPLAKMGWLTRPNEMLDGDTPLSALRAGRIDEVMALAQGVGID